MARNRNKEETKARILEAVGKLLAESGFNALGVNAIAREAGVDKVLIYRYFESLPNLIRTFAQDSHYLSGIIIPPEMENASSLTEGLVALILYYQKELQDRPITQEIIRWELMGDNDLIKEIINARYAIGIARLKYLEDKFGLPADQDIVAMVTVLAAGVVYLLLRAKNNTGIAGLSFSSAEGWARIDAVITKMVHGMMAESDLAPLSSPELQDSEVEPLK
jgi:AcrR family transcriptional regulator